MASITLRKTKTGADTLNYANHGFEGEQAFMSNMFEKLDFVFGVSDSVGERYGHE